MFVSLDIYEKFVLKLYLRKFLSSPMGIEPVSPDCRLRPYTLLVKLLYRQSGDMGSIPVRELRNFLR